MMNEKVSNNIERYYSENAEGDRMALGDAMLDRVLSHIRNGNEANALWRHFEKKAQEMRAGIGPVKDPLFLLHSNVYYLRDLLEDANDYEAIELLDDMERDFF
ncbi:N(2)-fixation sustaining protein CowN [Shewanella avicenniae]|uniref:N(2)-fixation sustaining protein CowN n=1 Tax=Shewanella avicenniae TaxID=2814294 RepID=A0ABX7QQZ4_9GAMM|nr:N(2)-fixation sustaining protein CowN [Shewanella avicenniae]QSX33886.1 N(2)-fixation sustaining protein CowN [Shewanella avicenniae]